MEFSMPIRVRWDVEFRGRSERPKRIARRIREISPLFVELLIEGDRGISELPGIFAEIHPENPRIEATVRLSRKSAAAAGQGLPIRFLWEVDPRKGIRGSVPDGGEALTFTPDEETIGELPALLREFSASKALEFHLPNINAVRSLAERGHVPVPTPGKLRETAAEIARLGVSLKGKRLVVHDFFLWKALMDSFPRLVGGRGEFAGCQAGSALAHVDWEGNLYPCDSLPIRLGNLLETPFEALWRTPSRESLAETIRRTPGGCLECAERIACHGGCRGLAYLAGHTFDCPDPSCPVQVSGGS